MKKRFLAVIGGGLLCAAALCACGSDTAEESRRGKIEEDIDESEDDIEDVNAPFDDHEPEPAESPALMPLYDADLDYTIAYVKPAEGFTYFGDPAPTEDMLFIDKDENAVKIVVDLGYSYWKDILENGTQSVQGGFTYYTTVDENNYAEIMVDLQYAYDFSPVYLIMEGTWDSEAGKFGEDGVFSLMFLAYDDTCVEIRLSRDMVENWNFYDYQEFMRKWFPEDDE